MKSKKMFKLFVGGVVLVFLFSYFIENSFYYEYSLHNKKNLTEEQMLQFEEDVKFGKEIDLDSYLKDSNTDYSNTLTKTMSETSLKLNEYLKKFLTGGFDLLGKFVK